MDSLEPAASDPAAEDKTIESEFFESRLAAFLASEGAVAWVRMAKRDGRLVHGDVDFDPHRIGKTPPLPAIELAAEDYRRLARLASFGAVSLEFDISSTYHDDDSKAYNILAEIPGRSSKDGYVLAGAHLDSWAAGDGAADNAAGVAGVMEAARLLRALGLTPKRTIRFALWNGEEEGLLGSSDYVARHPARRPPNSDPKKAELAPWWSGNTYPITPLPEFDKLAGYFNVDRGSGKIRGTYAEGNLAAVPVLKEWLAPLASLGASSVVANGIGGSDNLFMSRVGLPAFQFIQDPLDYFSQVHHSDLDTFDRLRIADLKQAAAVLAIVLLNAAESPEPLSRNVLPSRPRPPEPFEQVGSDNEDLK